jgi:hypothetical protein
VADTEKSNPQTEREQYNPHHYVLPQVNPTAIVWILLLGLPGLMIFLILEKQGAF